MRKGFLIVLAVALVAVLAAPAMADTSLNGFIRSRGFVSNFKAFGSGYIAPVLTGTAPAASYVEERARFLIKTGDENAKAIAQFEFDQAWGDTAYTNGRNMGGGLDSDTTNIETKNLYVWFKVPNTSWEFTAGVQPQFDDYAGVFVGVATDVAGVFTTFKYDPVTFRLGAAKFWENNFKKADDVDWYVAEAKFAPVKDVKLGLNFYFLNDMGGGLKGPTSAVGVDSNGDTIAGLNGRGAVGTWMPAEIASGYRTLRVYMPGASFSANVGPATLSGFAFYQFGKAEYNTGAPSVDIKGYAADVRADAKLGPGNAFLEFLYVSGDNNKTDKDYKSIITGSNYQLATSYYYRGDFQILFPNGDDCNTSYGLAYDPANGGAGVVHVAAGYTQKLMDKLTGRIGAGYLAAAKKRVRDIGAAYNFANNSAMGTEVNATLTYNITKGLDLGLVGAYAWLGNAYKAAGADPDNLYDVHARLNYAF